MSETAALTKAILDAEEAHERAQAALPEARRVAEAEVAANRAVAELDDACRAYDAALDALPERQAVEDARQALLDFQETAQGSLV